MPRVPHIQSSEVELAHAAAQKVVETHRRLAAFIREGMTLARIDAEVARILDELGCRSCFHGYKVPRTPPFPSHACLSLNECIVHGTAAYHTGPLKPGDILKIDIGVRYRGWIGDAAWTYAIREASDEHRRLMECGMESLRRGIPMLSPDKTYMAWAQVVQQCVEEEYGFHCVRGLGGHGIGRHLHGPPFVSNVVPSYPGEWPDGFATCQPGTLLAVEPMIAIGTPQTVQAPKQWPIFTADGTCSVHYEADVYIDEDGPRDLTEGMSELPMIIG